MRALPLRFGWRYLRARKRNQFVSFVSLSSMIGIALGMTVLITVLSIMNGFGDALRARILGTVPHLVVRADANELNEVASQLQGLEDVAAVGPFFETQAMLLNRSTVMGIGLFGIDPQREADLSIVPAHMVSGSLEALDANEPTIVLGAPIAYRLGLFEGESVSVLIPIPDGTGGVTPRVGSFRLVGTFAVDAEVDYGIALMHWQQAVALGIEQGGVLGVRARLQDAMTAPQAALRAQSLGEVRSWTDRYGELFAAVGMEKAMMGVLLALVITIASFNVVSSLVMLVDEKRGDIAVLRTMGASRAMIGRIFLAHGALVAFGGVLLGTLAGIWLAQNVTLAVRLFETLASVRLLEGTYFDEIPSTVRLSDVLAVQMLGVLVSLLAMVYPARRAARLDPVQSLHRE